MAHLHAFSSATSSGFQHDGVANFVGDFGRFLKALEDAFVAGNGRYTGGLHGGLGRSFVTHGLNHLRTCPDELDIVLAADAGEFSIFREESVAWVNGIGVGDFRCRDNLRDGEVRIHAFRRANADRFICEAHVQAVCVRCGVHSYGFDAHFLASTNHAQGDFPAVCNQDFLKHSEGCLGRIHQEEWLIVFYRAIVVHEDLDNLAADFRFDFVEKLHGFDDAKYIAIADG